MKTMTIGEFQAELKAQGVAREDMAFVCPICKTVQSMRSLVKAGAGQSTEEVERYIGFSCVGRFTQAGGHKTGTPPGKGCNWTLGGLLQLHELEVIDPAGRRHPHFVPASPAEAVALAGDAANG